jgi:GNAT superfamily N-acetyltransferase
MNIPREELSPEVGACWTEIAGAYAAFDGVTSPITQTFALGILQPPTEEDFENIEAFYRQFDAPVFHEVSPLADPATFEFLSARGYQPFEFTSVMFRPIGLVGAERNENLHVRIIGEGDHDLWAETSAKGWSQETEYADLILDLARIGAKRKDGLSFLAELGGRPIATGSLILWEGVALLAGASTIPEARRLGAQAALLDARLRYAQEKGCDIAMMCAAPGSVSQRNAERQGFRIAYTRIKWRLD